MHKNLSSRTLKNSGHSCPNVVFSNMGQVRPLFCLFSSFPYHNSIKKSLDSNPGQQMDQVSYAGRPFVDQSVQSRETFAFCWAVVVAAQLSSSLLIPEIRRSNPVVGNFHFFLLSTVLKKLLKNNHAVFKMRLLVLKISYKIYKEKIVYEM